MIALAALLMGAPVVSPAPDKVAVTVYRAPNRTSGAFDLDWLEGFALITETRTVALPAGDAEVRFEGVAGGIVPVSAIIAGLPGGTIEKNRDARLLSPASLVDGTLGNRVHLRRTNPATGSVREEEAVIRSTSAGALVLQTAVGVEALRCAGLPETIVYDGVPAGLSAKPTLAVTTRSPAAATATVTLSYLASGFDWGASYVARVAEDGQTLDLFAWATLANGNGESFAEAETQAVAGRLERAEARRLEGASNPALMLQCWPMDGTSTADDIAKNMNEIVVSGSRTADDIGAFPLALAAPAPPPPPPPPVMAQQEELGDLKLYRIPEPVTVAANSQKQVALMDRRRVPFTRYYRATVAGGRAGKMPAQLVLRTRNDAKNGLGLPLPSGGVAVFGRSGGRELLIDEGRMRDLAVNEEVEIALAPSPQVQLAIGVGDDPDLRTASITNANPFAVDTEVTFGAGAKEEIAGPSTKLGRKDGQPLWKARVPANGTATLRYRMRSLD